MLKGALLDARWTGHLVAEGDQPWTWYDPSRYDDATPEREAADPTVEAAALLGQLVRRVGKRFTLASALAFLDDRRPGASAELMIAFCEAATAHGVVASDRARSDPARGKPKGLRSQSPADRAAYYKARYQRRKARYATMTAEEVLQDHGTIAQKRAHAERQARIAAGLPIQRRDFEPIDEERMASLFRQYGSPTIVAREYGCSCTRATNWFKRQGTALGLTLRPFNRRAHDWTTWKLGKLRSCILLGMSKTATARQLGITVRTINRAIERHPYLVAPKAIDWTPRFVAYVGDMIELGMPLSAIAEDLGYSLSRMSAYYSIVTGKKSGCTAPRKGRKVIGRIGR